MFPAAAVLGGAGSSVLRRLTDGCAGSCNVCLLVQQSAQARQTPVAVAVVSRLVIENNFAGIERVHLLDASQAMLDRARQQVVPNRYLLVIIADVSWRLRSLCLMLGRGGLHGQGHTSARGAALLLYLSK